MSKHIYMNKAPINIGIVNIWGENDFINVKCQLELLSSNRFVAI